MVEVETVCPNSSSKASRCSSRVRSSLAWRCSGSHSLSIVPFLAGLPGIGSGSTSPVSLRLLSQRFMVGIDTEKVFATSSLGVPASTAESTLNLRSFAYGLMPGGYHIWIDTYGCRCQKFAPSFGGWHHPCGGKGRDPLFSPSGSGRRTTDGEDRPVLQLWRVVG